MTIQLSVTIWTIICFLLLVVILHRLLFQPVLRVMDDRRERIENAARKKAEYERMGSEQETGRLEQEAAASLARQRQIKAAADAIRSESRKAMETAKKERILYVEEYRAKAAAGYAENLNALSVHVFEIATAFADSLTKE